MKHLMDFLSVVIEQTNYCDEKVATTMPIGILMIDVTKQAASFVDYLCEIGKVILNFGPFHYILGVNFINHEFRFAIQIKSSNPLVIYQILLNRCNSNVYFSSDNYLQSIVNLWNEVSNGSLQEKSEIFVLNVVQEPTIFPLERTWCNRSEREYFVSPKNRFDTLGHVSYKYQPNDRLVNNVKVTNDFLKYKLRTTAWDELKRNIDVRSGIFSVLVNCEILPLMQNIKIKSRLIQVCRNGTSSITTDSRSLQRNLDKVPYFRGSERFLIDIYTVLENHISNGYSLIVKNISKNLADDRIPIAKKIVHTLFTSAYNFAPSSHENFVAIRSSFINRTIQQEQGDRHHLPLNPLLIDLYKYNFDNKFDDFILDWFDESNANWLCTVYLKPQPCEYTDRNIFPVFQTLIGNIESITLQKKKFQRYSR
jgi:hypothetical protein